MSGNSAFNHDDIEQILRIVDRLTDVEVRVEHGDLKLHVRKFSGAEPEAGPPVRLGTTARSNGEPAPAPDVPAAAAAAPSIAATVRASEATPEATVAVRAPMLGRFFRAPSPSEPRHTMPVQPASTIQAAWRRRKSKSIVRSSRNGVVMAGITPCQRVVGMGRRVACMLAPAAPDVHGGWRTACREGGLKNAAAQAESGHERGDRQ